MKHTKLKLSVRVLSVLMAAMMLGTALSAAAFSLGDVNLDNAINASDATRVLLHVVGKITLDVEQEVAADVNNDGKVNASDATLILLHAVGKKLIGEEAKPDTDGGLLTIKKGVGASRYGGAGKNADQMAKLEALNIGWYYNWGFPAYDPNAKIEAVAQFWGGAPNVSTINYYKKLAEQGSYKNLLGFNEPDLASQSNLTVDSAIASWKNVEDLADAIGARLGSPAPASYGSGGWLDQFMTKTKENNMRVDFIALHCYQMFGNLKQVDNLKSMLTGIYDKYQIPIWLTEFGAIDTSAWYGSSNILCTQENAVLYCTAASEMLESLGFIERYAWFVDNYGQHGNDRPKEGLWSALYNDDDTISETGKAYAAVKSTTGMIIKSTSLPAVKAGEAYEAEVVVAGGVQPYTFSAENLPEGLTIDENTGKITGNPTGKGAYKSTVYITDANGQATHYVYKMMEAKEVKFEKTGWTGAFAKYVGSPNWFDEDIAANEIVDGKANTGFTIPRTLTVNDMFKINLGGKMLEIQKIVFTCKEGGVPTKFKVQCDSGSGWKDYPYATKTEGNVITVTFNDTVSASSFMIQAQAKDDAITWTLNEVDVYGLQ